MITLATEPSIVRLAFSKPCAGRTGSLFIMNGTQMAADERRQSAFAHVPFCRRLKCPLHKCCYCHELRGGGVWGGSASPRSSWRAGYPLGAPPNFPAMDDRVRRVIVNR